MKFDEILDMWDVDTEIDRSRIDEEARKIPRLHAKYLRMLAHEKLSLRALEASYRSLVSAKTEFYVQGPANNAEIERRKAEGWKVAPKLGITVLRSSVGQYLDADEDINNLRFKKEASQTKIDVLNMIMESIMKRGFLLNTMQKSIEWDGGGS